MDPAPIPPEPKYKRGYADMEGISSRCRGFAVDFSLFFNCTLCKMLENFVVETFRNITSHNGIPELAMLQ